MEAHFLNIDPVYAHLRERIHTLVRADPSALPRRRARTIRLII